MSRFHREGREVILSLDSTLTHYRTINTQGEKNGFAKLSEAQVKQVKQLLINDDLTHKEIGSRFGVARKTISDINANRRWKHITIYQSHKDIAS